MNEPLHIRCAKGHLRQTLAKASQAFKIRAPQGHNVCSTLLCRDTSRCKAILLQDAVHRREWFNLELIHSWQLLGQHEESHVVHEHGQALGNWRRCVLSIAWSNEGLQ